MGVITYSCNRHLPIQHRSDETFYLLRHITRRYTSNLFWEHSSITFQMPLLEMYMNVDDDISPHISFYISSLIQIWNDQCIGRFIYILI